LKGSETAKLTLKMIQRSFGDGVIRQSTKLPSPCPCLAWFLLTLIPLHSC